MANEKLLEGIVILDFTQMIASSFATRILADFGAEILKVERYPIGDGIREAGTYVVDGSNQLFLNASAGKKSLCVDFRNDEAIQLIKEMVKHVHAVMEGFVPGQIKKYGLDYESLRPIKPDIVYTSMSGFGQYGPYRDWVCFADAAQSMAGTVYVTGEPNGHPQLIGNAEGDPISATHGCLATLAALLRQQRTGKGQYIDTAMMDSILFMDTLKAAQVAITDGKADPGRFGQYHDFLVPLGIWECQGQYVYLETLGSGERSMWGRFCHAIGRSEMITDPRYDTQDHRREHRAEVIQLIQQWFDRQPSAQAAVEYLQKHRVVCTYVQSPRQVILGPQVKERELVKKVYHPVIDREATIMVTPYKFSETPVQVEQGAPLLGQHNEYILKKYLSYNDELIKELYDHGAIYQDPRTAELKARENGWA